MASTEIDKGASDISIVLNAAEPPLPIQPTDHSPTDQASAEPAYHQSQPTEGEVVALEFTASEQLSLPSIIHTALFPDSNSEAAVTTLQLVTQGPESNVCDVFKGDVIKVDASRTKPKRTKRRVTGSRTCRVCGDLAIAHNFGALTCETCKAFFRRNASKAQDMPACVFNKSCVITRTTRRFCASCRMEKCFAVGMDPLLILDPEEKKALQVRKKQKQRQQEELILPLNSCTPSLSVQLDCTAAPCPSLPLADHPPSAESLELQSDLSSLMLAASSAAPCVESSHLQPVCEDTLKDSSSGVGVEAGCPTRDANPSQMFEPFLAQGQRFRHVEREQLPWDMKLYWLLKEEERNLLTTLTTAYTNIQITLHPPEPSDNLSPDQPLCLDSIMFILESTLRKCVHFAKTIPHFMDLSEGDQIAVLKASALETYALRSAALFVVERNSWHTYFRDLHLKDVKKIFDDHGSVEMFARYCAALKSVVKANSTIYALLHCIILFEVRNTRLEDYSKVSAIQDHYLVLLKHYLQSEFSYMHASRYLAELMALLEDMHQLHHKIVFFYKQFSSFFRPLISEFFAA